MQDLTDRLQRTRFPADQIDGTWHYGTPLGYARRLRDHWLTAFDWRSWERRINEFEQRMVSVDGQDIHMLVEPGSGDRPLPLFLTHGWPGSFLEFIDLVEPLAHPERFGGRIEDAFTVVLPSLPGFGYSPAPSRPLKPRDIAILWSKLAIEEFGFAAYGAQGGDWGSAVTANLALLAPKCLVGVHLNMAGIAPTLDAESAPLAEEERVWIGRSQARMGRETGYQQIQATRPQSLAYGHTDSPIGLAGWIAEKFQRWTVPDETTDPPFQMDHLLANIMLYWINGSNAPSWLYVCLMDQQSLAIPGGARISVPAGFTLFENDLLAPPPRLWLDRCFADISYYNVVPDGGHFPAMERGKLLVDEIRRFFANHRP